MDFELWSVWHFLFMLSPFVITSAIYFIMRNKSDKAKYIVGIVLGTLSLLSLIVRNIDIFIRNGWNLEVIPLQVCHIGNIVTGLALITKKKWLCLTVFCFNLIPAIAAIIFADSLTNYSNLLAIRPQCYIWGHILIVVCALYGVLIYPTKPTKKDAIYSLTFIGIIAICAIICNSAFRSAFNWKPNYFYLYDYKGTPLKFLYTVFETSEYGWFKINWFYSITLIVVFVLAYIALYWLAKLIYIKLHNQSTQKIKAIMFDFDGTLTKTAPNIWKKIWNELGYNTTDKKNSEYYTQLYDYLNHKTTYQEWCNQTCESFKKKQMNKNIMPKLVADIELMEGFESFIKTLKSKGISLHIVSGNFVEVINTVLGKNVKYFDSINANTLEYDENGYLTHIKGTNYDFEGKANFMIEYKDKHNLNTENICFVGNGDNDEYAHLSGCRTICINPDNTDGENKTLWHTTLNNVTNLNQILDELLK